MIYSAIDGFDAKTTRYSLIERSLRARRRTFTPRSIDDLRCALRHDYDAPRRGDFDESDIAE